jgi:phage shock protein PspC (stress-responsive transcriptional regulator)
MMDSLKAFRRANQHSFAGGVLAGIAYQMEAPPWVLRIGTGVIAWFLGPLSIFIVIPYVLLWMSVPVYEKDPEDFETVTGSKTPPQEEGPAE